jgi:hypothetical protein
VLEVGSVLPTHFFHDTLIFCDRGLEFVVQVELGCFNHRRLNIAIPVNNGHLELVEVQIWLGWFLRGFLNFRWGLTDFLKPLRVLIFKTVWLCIRIDSLFLPHYFKVRFWVFSDFWLDGFL